MNKKGLSVQSTIGVIIIVLAIIIVVAGFVFKVDIVSLLKNYIPDLWGGGVGDDDGVGGGDGGGTGAGETSITMYIPIKIHFIDSWPTWYVAYRYNSKKQVWESNSDYQYDEKNQKWKVNSDEWEVTKYDEDSTALVSKRRLDTYLEGKDELGGISYFKEFEGLEDEKIIVRHIPEQIEFKVPEGYDEKPIGYVKNYGEFRKIFITSPNYPQEKGFEIKLEKEVPYLYAIGKKVAIGYAPTSNNVVIIMKQYLDYLTGENTDIEVKQLQDAGLYDIKPGLVLDLNDAKIYGGYIYKKAHVQ